MNKKYNFYNVLFIFILGTLLHFTYNWSNNNFIVGLFSSTNESIFSHTKNFYQHGFQTSEILIFPG